MAQQHTGGGGRVALAVDHVGAIVDDFAPLRAVLGDLLGLEVPEPEVEEATGMEVLWVDAGGGVQLQFIRPTRDDTPAARLLRERGPGIHHVGVEVSDIDGLLAGLRAAGIPTRDEVGRQGARGARVGFLDPSAVGGVEVELVERGR